MRLRFEFLRRSKKTVALVVVVAAITIVSSTLIALLLRKTTGLNIPSFGTIATQGVEAFWDPDMKNKTESIDWGRVYPGSSKVVTLHLRSTSNIATFLVLRTGNWTFFDSNNGIVAQPTGMAPYVNLTWNYNNATVQPGEVLQVMLTLSVDRSSDFIEFLIANDVRAFSVDIIISTSEYS